MRHNTLRVKFGLAAGENVVKIYIMEKVIQLSGRDCMSVEVNEQSGAVTRVKVFGCRHLLKLVGELRRTYGVHPQNWPLPHSTDHASLLVRKFILVLKNQWQLPVEGDEICHCRQISSAVVEEAIMSGAHTPELVSRWTSASTACGTCRPIVSEVLQYLLPSEQNNS